MISVSNISKTFKLYHNPADRLKEIVLRKTFHKNFEALKNISFTVQEGETLGIVGENGAGKSTLLKILTGVLMSDTGTVHVDGRITGLLELGTGFNHEFSGVQNIYLNGTYLGMSRQEIDARKEAIIAFTELGDFIHEPLKTYSSGMVMRLAFSIAMHADPKAFVVDEALSVGDAYFQQKSMNKIRQFKKEGGSIVFVSHDMNAVKLLCDKAILLEAGRIVEFNEPEEVVNRYNWLVAKKKDKGQQVIFSDNGQFSHGSMEARVVNVTIQGLKSKSNVISSGEYAEIIVEIFSERDFSDVTSGILIRDRFGQDIFGTNTYLNDIALEVKADCACYIKYVMKMDIGVGKYTVSAALQKTPDSADYKRLHWVDKVTNFEVVGCHGSSFLGVCKLHPKIDVSEKIA